MLYNKITKLYTDIYYNNNKMKNNQFQRQHANKTKGYYMYICSCIIKRKTILKDKNQTIPVTSYATITLDYEELATPCLTIERRHT